MNCIQKKEETGRSMVEILGVLVVIGILTIAGLIFYRTAINKHKAVEIYGVVGVTGAQMLIKQKPNARAISNVTVTTQGIQGVGSNAIIKVDFGEDKDLCKEVKDMYENNSEYEFIGDCN